MIENLTKIYDGADLTGANPNVIYLPILADSTLKGIDILTDEATTGDAVFALKKNGAAIIGASAITISSGNKIGSISGLTIAIVKGDEITLDMLSGSVSIPLTLNLVVDDGAASGGGGGGGYYSPSDVPPTTAHAKSDEFDGTSLDAKWTPFLSPSLEVKDGFLIHTANNGVYNGIYQTIPSGTDWKVTIKGFWGGSISGSDNYICGFLLTPGNQMKTMAYGRDNGDVEGSLKIRDAIWNNATTSPSYATQSFNYSSTYYQGMGLGIIYFRFNCIASVIYSEWSVNGMFWKRFPQSSALASIDRIGIAARNNTATKSAFDFFRVS